MAEERRKPERRRQPRHLACFPVHLESPAAHAEPRTALIRDISATGALLLTRLELEVGETLRLQMYISDSDAPVSARAAQGRVVRCERRAEDRSDVWPYSVAITFDEPLSGAEEELHALAERLAKRGYFQTR